jgi:transcriptional regulator
MKQRYQNRIELLQGTLDLLILQTLRWGAQHGYGIALAIRANSGDILQVDTGSLYPALHRLERQKLIAAEWKVSENNQRVRVYRLSARAGRSFRRRSREFWGLQARRAKHEIPMGRWRTAQERTERRNLQAFADGGAGSRGAWRISGAGRCGCAA